MKMLVSTKGSFMLRSPLTGDEVPWNRIGLVRQCAFISSKIADDQAICHAKNIPDTATDAEWMVWVKECGEDMELAVASFEEKFKAPAPA